MDDSTLEGRTCLVTGGGRGIGRACSLRLAQAGVQIAVNYQKNGAAAEATVAEISAQGGVAMAVQADVSKPEQVDAMTVQIARQLGPIELLVNNAGVFEVGDHRQQTLDVWQRAIDVNLTGAYLTTWAVKEAMIQRQYGRIVNVASIAGLRARPNSIAYSVSKAGMIALTRSLADALAADGVRVNAVAPGLIETEIHEGVSPDTLNRLIDQTPIQRFGQPAEIAEAVFYLMSDLSSFTTGQTLVVDGGRVTLP